MCFRSFQSVHNNQINFLVVVEKLALYKITDRVDKVWHIRKKESAKREKKRKKLAQQKSEQTQRAAKSQVKKCKQRNANKVPGMRVFDGKK